VDFDARQLRIERTLQRGVFTAPKSKRSNATLLLVAGVPVHVVSERLGHADVTTLGVYAHVIPAQRRDAADRMAQLLAGVGS
jgi:integrase